VPDTNFKSGAGGAGNQAFETRLAPCGRVAVQHSLALGHVDALLGQAQGVGGILAGLNRSLDGFVKGPELRMNSLVANAASFVLPVAFDLALDICHAWNASENCRICEPIQANGDKDDRDSATESLPPDTNRCRKHEAARALAASSVEGCP